MRLWLVVHALWAGAGCSQPRGIAELDRAIVAELDAHPHPGRCAYELIAREDAGTRTTAYVWALCEEGAFGSSSMPLALVFVRRGDAFLPIGRMEPLDGDAYGPSIEAIFPAEALSRVFLDVDASNARVGRLEARLRADRSVP